MVFKKFFKKDKDEGPDPTAITLANLKKGYFVDYDLMTWEVTACNKYDWGAGEFSYEWQLTSSDETIFLEREVDDEDFWSIGRKIPFRKLPSGIREHIHEHEDPPDEIQYEGKTYYLEEMSGGHFYPDSKSEHYELLSWDYEDESGKNLLSIEQWGEDDFSASIGEPVFEYQFTNITIRDQI